jgi:hypothetical protein
MLERLKKIDLRKAWKSEDQEFTPWLASEENLELLGDKLEWRELPDNTKSEISLSKNGVDTKNEPDWVNQHKWFKENIEKFDKIFRKRIKKLNAEDWAG